MITEKNEINENGSRGSTKKQNVIYEHISLYFTEQESEDSSQYCFSKKQKDMRNERGNSHNENHVILTPKKPTSVPHTQPKNITST